MLYALRHIFFSEDFIFNYDHPVHELNISVGIFILFGNSCTIN